MDSTNSDRPQVAEIINTNVRKSDIVARIGNDEFCVLFADCGIEDVDSIGRSIRHQVQRIELKQNTHATHVACRIGLVSMCKKYKSASHFLSAAMAAAEQDDTQPLATAEFKIQRPSSSIADNSSDAASTVCNQQSRTA